MTSGTRTLGCVWWEGKGKGQEAEILVIDKAAANDPH